MKKIKIVGMYSFIHCMVDMACATMITYMVNAKNANEIILLISIILYNFFAFAIQLPVGIIADKVNKNAIVSAIGCMLVCFSYFFTSVPVIACIIAGLGNAMFHIGGGVDTLNISDGKATLPRYLCINRSVRTFCWYECYENKF